MIGRGVLIGLVLLPAAAVFGYGGWADPPGGWQYAYEADDGEAAYVATDWTLGCLDGQWQRSSSSDEWDGSGCGDLAPGGVWIEQIPGGAENGEDASVLSIEDPGDPRNAPYNMPDPSNRKVFLVKDAAGYDITTEGITFVARLRINPEPCVIALANAGYTFHDGGKGSIGYAQEGAVTLTAVFTDAGSLQIGSISGGGVAGEIPLGPPGEWVTIWVAAIAEAGGYRLSAWIDGSDPGAPEIDGVFTGLENGTEGTVDRYFLLAQGSTGQDGSIQIDYFAMYPEYLEPEALAPGCPTNFACQPDAAAKKVVLTWDPIFPTPASFKIERDGTVLEAALTGTATSYEDTTVGIGAHEYELTAEGCTEEPTLCKVNLCPSGLACTTPNQTDVVLTWKNPFPPDSYRILRNGVEIGTAPGDATSFTDSEGECGRLNYEVRTVPADCGAISCDLARFCPEKAYAAPDGGWDYCYDPMPGDRREDMVQYEPLDQTPGCLDGEWQRSDGSDRWDGSAPGEVDEDDPNGPAPGGIGLLELDGQGYSGERIGVLTLEDTGDPSVATFLWNGVAKSWTDGVDASIDGTGSNRKIFIGADLDRILGYDPLLNMMAEGATLSARFRLMPLEDAEDVRAETIGLDAPQGSTLDGSDKGFINLYTEVGGTAKLSFAIDGSADTGYKLLVGGVADATFPIIDPTAWFTLYATIEDLEFDGTYDLRLYANGDTDPFYETEDYVPPDDGSELGSGGSQNYIMLGSNQTGEVCAYELDFICVRQEVVPPKEGVPGDVFLRGDTDGNGTYTLGDGVQVLERLFANRTAYTSNCEDTGDLDDNGILTIGDAIWLFNFIFATGDLKKEPFPPYPLCGVDPTPATALGCAGYPAANCPK
ncbi:MAG: hypothetical protein JXP34_00265 [Planctomycetes bacterium]|nr:hypothetical protein [Planctomycetota bacterium]